MVEQEGCELLAKARLLAMKRGLDPDKVACVFPNICKGTTCFLLEEYEERSVIPGERVVHQAASDSEPHKPSK